jgi:hypothetical protein
MRPRTIRTIQRVQHYRAKMFFLVGTTLLLLHLVGCVNTGQKASRQQLAQQDFSERLNKGCYTVIQYSGGNIVGRWEFYGWVYSFFSYDKKHSVLLFGDSLIDVIGTHLVLFHANCAALRRDTAQTMPYDLLQIINEDTDNMSGFRVIQFSDGKRVNEWEGRGRLESFDGRTMFFANDTLVQVIGEQQIFRTIPLPANPEAKR